MLDSRNKEGTGLNSWGGARKTESPVTFELWPLIIIIIHHSDICLCVWFGISIMISSHSIHAGQDSHHLRSLEARSLLDLC